MPSHISSGEAPSAPTVNASEEDPNRRFALENNRVRAVSFLFLPKTDDAACIDERRWVLFADI